MDKKLVFDGWCGKNWDLAFWYNRGYYEMIKLNNIYKIRGPKESWSEKEWPPKRVRVTVEVIE